MKNKKIPILVSMMLISTLILITNVNSEEQGIKNKSGFILDQMQTTSSYYDVISAGNSLAQSFQPTLTPLAKVRLLINREENNNAPLIISIRNNINGEDLTSIEVPSSYISTTTKWINIDFPDISVNIEETYFIVAKTNTYLEYHWFVSYNQDVDFYEQGEGWFKNYTLGNNWMNYDEFTQAYIDFCFKTYSYSGRQSNLECNDIFGWPNQQPGSIINDSFTIKNIGDPLSLLHWEVEEIPTWGNWTITPNGGFDLTPEEGEVTININVEIPDEKNKNYDGEIKIVNKDNESDYCIISVSMSTPKNKEKPILDILLPLIQKILQRFQIFQI
jgi:hypothetical protein